MAQQLGSITDLQKSHIQILDPKKWLTNNHNSSSRGTKAIPQPCKHQAYTHLKSNGGNRRCDILKCTLESTHDPLKRTKWPLAIDLLDQQGESRPPQREETEVRTLLFTDFSPRETEHSRDDGLDIEGAYSQPSVNKSAPGVTVQACNQPQHVWWWGRIITVNSRLIWDTRCFKDLVSEQWKEG